MIQIGITILVLHITKLHHIMQNHRLQHTSNTIVDGITIQAHHIIKDHHITILVLRTIQKQNTTTLGASEPMSITQADTQGAATIPSPS